MSDWTWSWEQERADKRAAWATLTPAQLLEWLEDGLDALAALGTLEPDRRRRADEASRWSAER